MYETLPSAQSADAALINKPSWGGSWGAILAGATAAVAITLGFTILGSGLGLAIASPWSPNTASIAGFTAKVAIWMIVTQWVASALGGYLAGRLRTRWNTATNDEVFFRDTANGFLAWAVATVFTAGFLVSVIGTVVGGGVSAASTVAAGAAAGASAAQTAENTTMVDSFSYTIDSLYRTDRTGGMTDRDVRLETGRIFTTSVRSGDFSAVDRAYLVDLVQNRTGISNSEATARVNAAITSVQNDVAAAKDAADKARKAGATFSIVTFLAMAVGAFIAAVSAALGGRLRDEV